MLPSAAANSSSEPAAASEAGTAASTSETEMEMPMETEITTEDSRNPAGSSESGEGVEREIKDGDHGSGELSRSDEIPRPSSQGFQGLNHHTVSPVDQGATSLSEPGEHMFTKCGGQKFANQINAGQVTVLSPFKSLMALFAPCPPPKWPC